MNYIYHKFCKEIKCQSAILLRIIVLPSYLYSVSCHSDWFEEVATSAGVAHEGRSFGASWGDANSDGWPDLYISNHANIPVLYINTGSGSFSNGTNTLNYTNEDMHGASWCDYDNDGDQDLLQSVGADDGIGEGPNQFFINTPDGFVEQSTLLGLDYPLARGRTPLWLDWNNDGLADVVLSGTMRSDGQGNTELFTSINALNFETTPESDFSVRRNNFYSQIMTIGLEYVPALVVQAGSFPDRLYDVSKTPFNDLKMDLGLQQTTHTQDTVIGDFNGDLLPDIYITRAIEGRSEVAQINPTTIAASIIATPSDSRGVVIRANGVLNIRIEPLFRVSLSDIYIGENSIHPPSNTFELSPDNTAYSGLPEYTLGSDSGVFIGYIPERNEWNISVTAPRGRYNMEVVSQSTITDFSTIGIENKSGEEPDVILTQGISGFTRTELVETSSCGSVASADFDNDMDLDLYLVCRGIVSNKPNILYENMGNGTFRSVPNAGGASGSVEGIGDSVALADYDQDGFIDFVVTNGFGLEPFPVDGPRQLYRNLGNANHWLELDLEGVVSNRDGIGATVLATVGTKVQFRLQDGGMHRGTQNYKRIHFGLGDHAMVDKLTVNWPSGIVQTLRDFPADQIIHLVEPTDPSPNGKPVYSIGTNAGVYLWKSSFDGPYHIQIVGNGPVTNYELSVISDKELTNVSGQYLESDDSLIWSGNFFSLDSQVSTYIDGVDFQIIPGSSAYLSVLQDGAPNPRQIYTGAAGTHITPCGWILNVDELPELPPFQGGSDLGLFIGQTNSSVGARWTGDGQTHTAELEMIFTEQPSSIEQVYVELNDNIEIDELSLKASTFIDTGADGLNVTLSPDSHMLLHYVQDHILQTNRVNGNDKSLGMPNAYHLPLADPYGSPQYNPSIDKNLFIWKDESSNTWHVRATAGGDNVSYQGRFVSDGQLLNVSPEMLESSDEIDVSDENQIYFKLNVGGRWEDGFSFTLPDTNSSLELQLYQPSTGNTSEALPLIGENYLQIGSHRLPVDTLPLDLSGW